MSDTSALPSASASAPPAATHVAPAARQKAARAKRHRVIPSLPVSTDGSSEIQPQSPPDSCRARGSGLFSLPDARCTPGAVSPAVSQANIQLTICRRGYTKTVRPPESVTEREKKASLAAYGDDDPLHAYEYDHLVPLELGGAPNDPRNLWPEPGASPNPKDELEDRLCTMVCAGQLTLRDAQHVIADDWISAYHHFVG